MGTARPSLLGYWEEPCASGKWPLLSNVGVWSPSSSLPTAPRAWILGLFLSYSIPCLRPAPSCLRRGEEVRAVLTQALVRRCPVGGPQDQDHHQQPERSGLHGHRQAGSGDPSTRRTCRDSREDAFIPPCLHRHSGFCLLGDGPPLWLRPHLLSLHRTEKPPAARPPEGERGSLTPPPR